MSRFLLPSALAVVMLSPGAFAKAPKKAPAAAAAKTAPSRSQACWKKFAAVCEAMQRCVTNPEDLGGPNCQAIDPGCDQLEGAAAHSGAQLEACVSGLKKLSCSTRVEPEAFEPERSVPACAALARAEEQAASSHGALATSR